MPTDDRLHETARIRRIRGEGFVMLRTALRASMPEEEWHAVLDGLPSEVRALLETRPDPMQWVDIDVAKYLVRSLGPDRFKPLGTLPGALSAEQIQAVHPEWFTSPGRLADMIPTIWASRMEGGWVEVRHLEDGAWEVRIAAVPNLTFFFGVYLCQWVQRMFQLAGMASARLIYESPTDPEGMLHRYRVIPAGAAREPEAF